MNQPHIYQKYMTRILAYLYDPINGVSTSPFQVPIGQPHRLPQGKGAAGVVIASRNGRMLVEHLNHGQAPTVALVGWSFTNNRKF